MAELLTMEEISNRYPSEWLLIAYEELDEELEVRRGTVLAHSPDRDEVYRALLAHKGRQVAIEYTGPIPEDLAVAL